MALCEKRKERVRRRKEGREGGGRKGRRGGLLFERGRLFKLKNPYGSLEKKK